MFKKPKEVSSFTSLKIKISGMRLTEEYEIINKGKESELAYYTYRCTQSGFEPVLEKSVSIDTAAVTELLNELKIPAWDGFSGANPRGVRDGTMFSFKAEINGGETIRADGSNNFPKHYNDFLRKIRELLN